MSTVTAGDPSRPPGTVTPTGLISADLARNWWAVALRGVMGIIFGIIALVMPAATMLSLVLVFAAYMLIDGILAIVAAVRAARHREKWVWLTLEGVVNIVTAALAVLLPGLTVVVFVLLIAFWALLSGGLMLGAAFRLQPDHGRGWLIFGGIISIIYGALLMVARRLRAGVRHHAPGAGIQATVAAPGSSAGIRSDGGLRLARLQVDGRFL